VRELAHSGIDDRIAGSAALPGAQARIVLSPGEGIEGRLQVAVREIGPVIEQVSAELAPAELALCRLGDLRPEHDGRVALARQRRDDGGGRAAPEHKVCPDCLQACFET